MTGKLKEKTKRNCFFIIVVIVIFFFLGCYTWLESVKQQVYIQGYEHGVQITKDIFYHDEDTITINYKIKFNEGYAEGYNKGCQDCNGKIKPDKKDTGTTSINISDIKEVRFAKIGRWNYIFLD